MTFGDSLHYLTIGNPVSKLVIGTTSSIFSKGPGGNSNNAGTVKASADVVQAATNKAVSVVMPPLWKLAGRNYNFVRIAGLSGAAAVILGALGSHSLQDKTEARTIFETANRFHFFHSLAILGLPLTKRPLLTGFFLITGTALFSGTLYYRAFTGEKSFARLAPFGGTCLILAWLSLLL